MDEPDRTLVESARAGEAAAREALVRRHLRAAYAVALAVTQSPSDAEDLAQEAMVRALDRLESCKDPDRFGPWVCTIARNLSLNAKVSERRRADAVHGSGAQAGPDAERVWLRQRLLGALSVLGEVQRQVVLLHDLHGYSHAEVAAALEISEVNSRQQLFTARKVLRDRLRGEAPQEVQHGR